MSVEGTPSRALLNHDPLHLMSILDDPMESTEDLTQQTSPVKAELEKLAKSRSNDMTHTSKGLRVYVDEQNGSDNNGYGTRQEPYQSIAGALRGRAELDIEIYIKKRFVSDTEKFDPVKIPPNAIPVSVGGFVTEYWYPVEVSDTALEAIQLEKAAKYAPPSYEHAMEEKPEKSSTFLSKLRRKRTP